MNSASEPARADVHWPHRVIVFASGASALTYEVLWQREMFHVFGASAPATAAILTAIFLGIAWGSWASGLLQQRATSPLVWLAILEGLIGAWALLVPAALGIADRLYVAAAHRWGEDSAWLSWARFVLAILPLLPATLCMGATIPVMVRICERGSSTAVAWVYGLNILGAVAGALATGLLWIRVLGQADAVWVAVGLNALVVLLALFLSRNAAVAIVPGSAPLPTPTADFRYLGGLYFAAGFVALGLELVWLRCLGIINSNSTVTFSLTLAFYLAGMGAGSLWVYPRLRRRLSPNSVLALANGGVAVTSLATFPVVFVAPWINRAGIAALADAGTLTLGDVYQTEALIIGLLLFLPTVCMGLVYPAVCDSLPDGTARHREWIGKAYFQGTMGSVAGILVISLVMIPRWGLHVAFSVLVTLSSVLAAVSVIKHRRSAIRSWSLALLSLGVVAAVFVAVEGRPVLRNTVARRIDGQWQEFRLDDAERPTTSIARFRSGASGTVIAKREATNPNMLVYVDDQLVASTNIEARVDALMLAHLPLLLHPHPQSELTVGFGTGGTSHAITSHDVDAFCVEIEPEVPRAAELFTSQNYGVLQHPRFQLILNDARDHLKITQRQYDVIATDVTNLQYKQNSSLYTVEYFRLIQERLRPGGVACAWIPMAAIASEELQTLMRSFQHVFPHATLWFMNHTHTNFGILIGTSGPLQIDYGRLEAGFAQPAVAASLRQIGLVDPLQLVHCLQLDERGYRDFCGEAPLHTDNNPILEFSSPLSFYQYSETFRDNLAGQLARRPVQHQAYVRNGPEEMAPVWEQHRIASQSGCEVILSMYEFQVARARGDDAAALQYLQHAMRHADRGMAAWPEDRAREHFYVQFFTAADRWVKESAP